MRPSPASPQAQLSIEDAAALRERILAFVYPVYRVMFAFLPLGYLAFQGGDFLLHPDIRPESLQPRIAAGLVLALFGVFGWLPTAQRHLPGVWVLYVLLVEICISTSALGSPAGPEWAMPAYLLVPAVCAPFWPTRRAFATVVLLALLTPAVVLALAHAEPALIVRYAVYLFISVSIAIILAGAMVEIHLQGFLLDRRLRAAAFFDHLTGVLSRHRFFDLGQRLVDEARSQGAFLSALYLDVDHFKQLNDDLGHEAGDEALIAMATALRGELRTSDLIGRLGGEEFAALLPALPLELALPTAERLRRAIERLDHRRRPLTISIGVAELRSGQNLDDLLRNADFALRQAKLYGRNRVESAQAGLASGALRAYAGPPADASSARPE